LRDDLASALANDRIIDITTTGRTSGESRRIEIWFHRIDGRYYITGTPNRPRSWYANLLANPEFTFHLKQSAVGDLPAIARPITEAREREQLFDVLLARLGELTTADGMAPADWLANSPLIEVLFTN
jgi:deazaflavin-dependent oxidoreductase (nitroreductase family)